MGRHHRIDCVISGAEEDVFDADLPEEQEDPELPLGWVQLTLEKVIVNPEYAGALQRAVDGYVQLALQQSGASSKGKPVDVEKMRAEVTAAIEEGNIPGIELPSQHMVVTVTEHFCTDAEPVLKQSLATLHLTSVDGFFAAEGS